MRLSGAQLARQQEGKHHGEQVGEEQEEKTTCEGALAGIGEYWADVCITGVATS